MMLVLTRPEALITPPEAIELITSTLSTVERLREVAGQRGYAITALGCHRTPWSPLLISAAGRWWVLGLPVDVPCADEIQRTLESEGHRFSPGPLRAVYGLPVGWRFEDTLRWVIRGRMLKGLVPDESRLLGVPIAVEGSPFATWVGVDVSRRNLRSREAIARG